MDIWVVVPENLEPPDLPESSDQLNKPYILESSLLLTEITGEDPT